MTLADYGQAAIDLAALCGKLELNTICQFVPLSQSRNKPTDKDKGWRSLNWRCAVILRGSVIRGLEAVDYSQGSEHCPSYKKPPYGRADSRNNWQHSRLVIRHDAIALECETGKHAVWRWQSMESSNRKIDPPDTVDIIAALGYDSEVIDYPNFEDWAECFGYDPDSRKGEIIYRQCLTVALAFRAALGDESLSQIRELAREL